MAAHYVLTVPSGGQHIIRCRLSVCDDRVPLSISEKGFDEMVTRRKNEADEFYKTVIPESLSDEEVIVSRQSYAGLLWSKQFYYYVIDEWLKGDPSMPCPPHNRLNGRNSEWKYLHNKDVISMPDKWEYPWVSFTLKLRSSFWRNNVFSTRFISFFSMYIENIFNSYQNGSPHIRCAFKLAKNRDSPPPN